MKIKAGLLAQLLRRSLSMREIWGSIPGPIKSDAVSPTARHRCDVSSELCYPGANPPLVTRLRRNTASILNILFYLKNESDELAAKAINIFSLQFIICFSEIMLLLICIKLFVFWVVLLAYSLGREKMKKIICSLLKTVMVIEPQPHLLWAGRKIFVSRITEQQGEFGLASFQLRI